jgi:putative nucleotidyltransferase with HDIG domain
VVTGVIIWRTISTIEKKFQQLLESENDLRHSYNQTISSWGKALALVDKETEGHSQRVTELTLKIAKLHGIAEDDLEHIRRGALLHDIGKMSITEKVLNKRTSLSAKERALIEKHPLHAFTLLKDIPYLAKALEIPVYHHECWDGSGYPYHLSGKDIPLAARIFAIVDNWDALISDRPYRKAWPEDKVLLYLENESGKRFDPEVVDTFLRFIRKGQKLSQT